MLKVTKDPNAVLDYKWDWTDWMPPNDKIVASTFTTDDPALVVEDSLFDDLTTTAWLSGGIAGEVYIVTNHVTTDDGRQDDRSMRVVCKEL